MRCIGLSRRSSKRSSESARCEPRFDPATACTSSRITVSTPRSVSRACEVSSRKSDSGRGDEDVGRRLQHPPALVRGRVAGADADCELRLEARERAPQVALDVVVERLQRGDVEQPQPLPRRLVQPVDPREERRERLPGAGRRLDQDVPAAPDRRPAERLRGRRLLEHALEPRARRRREGRERVHTARVTAGQRHEFRRRARADRQTPIAPIGTTTEMSLSIIETISSRGPCRHSSLP